MSIDIRGQLGATLGAIAPMTKEVAPMPLTVTKIHNAKPGKKRVRLFDERGLYLEVSVLSS